MTREDIKYLVVHCSDWPENWWWPEQGYQGLKAGHNLTARDIHWYHQQVLGWHGIGYHWVIERDGELVPGRPWYWQGAHVRAHNHEALGICLVGRYPFTEAQHIILERWIRDTLQAFPTATLKGHRDLDPGKECPTFDVSEDYQKLQAKLAAKDAEIARLEKMLVETGRGQTYMDAISRIQQLSTRVAEQEREIARLCEALK